MHRRTFLKRLLACPAAVTTPGLLMPVKAWAPTLWGDGIHDDTEALQAAIDGLPVNLAPGVWLERTSGTINLGSGRFKMKNSLFFGRHSPFTTVKGGTLQLPTYLPAFVLSGSSERQKSQVIEDVRLEFETAATGGGLQFRVPDHG